MEPNSDHFEEDAMAIVRLEDGTVGWIWSYGAHFSTIVYEEWGGYRHKIVVPNEDFDIIGYIGVERETNDEL